MPAHMKKEGNTKLFSNQLTRDNLQKDTTSIYGTVTYDHKEKHEAPSRDYSPGLECVRTDAADAVAAVKDAAESASVPGVVASAKRGVTSIFRKVAPMRMQYEAVDDGKSAAAGSGNGNGAGHQYGGFGN